MEIELSELKQRIDGLKVNERGRRQYTSAIKRDVIAYVKRRRAEGASQAELSVELGIHQATVSEWTGERAKSKSKKKVRRVRVARVQRRRAEPVVVLPGDMRVEGLSFDDVVELLKALS